MLRSYKLQSILAILCYALVLLASLLLITEMTLLFHTDTTEGIGGAAVKIAAVLLGILGGISAIAALIPFTARLISLKKRRRVPIVICMVFDLLFAVFGASTVLDGIFGGDYDPAVYVVGGTMIAVAVFASVCNAFSIRLLRAERRGREVPHEANEN